MKLPTEPGEKEDRPCHNPKERDGPVAVEFGEAVYDEHGSPRVALGTCLPIDDVYLRRDDILLLNEVADDSAQDHEAQDEIEVEIECAGFGHQHIDLGRGFGKEEEIAAEDKQEKEHVGRPCLQEVGQEQQHRLPVAIGCVCAD